jgi:hypothetical protein
MANRRELMQAGLAASILPAGLIARQARAQTPLAVHRAIYDERFEAGRAFAVQARQRGWTTRAIRGDVTDLWFNELSLRWKQGPAPIAGLTAKNSLFCLERLAWDAGMRVVSRAEDPKSQLVAWLIAPPARA